MLTVVHSIPVWLEQTQTWVHSQVEYLPPDRVESHIVCMGTANLDQFPVAHLHSLRDGSRVRWFWDRALCRLRVRPYLGLLVSVTKRIQASLIHSHFADVGWADRGAARRARARHVVTFYGYDVNFLPRQPGWADRFAHLFASADRFLCEGSHMRNCIAALGCPAGKIIVHHLGVKLDQFPYRPRIWQPGEPLRILIAATFTQKKGIPYALEALGRLLQRQQVEVTLIGDARPGVAESLQEKRRILAAIDRFGLASRVRLLGYRPHSIMIEEAYRHHVFLAPSVTAENGATEGGAPVSIIEMAATGMPVVSTRHCDIPEVIQDRVTGLLADERDVTGLVECLEQLLAARESWRPMLDAGRRHVEAQYDAAIQGRRLAQTYEETVA